MQARNWKPLSELPYATGKPRDCGVIRSCSQDFQVDEDLGFAPDGEGEHVLLRIRKCNTNTEWLARQLARLAGVLARDVSFAGLKDRYAATTQWFSVRLAGKAAPNWHALENADIRILEIAAHGRKLRRGALRGNRFAIRIRGLVEVSNTLDERLERLRRSGLPNYFGEQRFGHAYGNLVHAESLFNGDMRKLPRHRRGLYLSAVRSQLFNQVLARRLEQGNWNRYLDGDLLKSTEDDRPLRIDAPDATLRRRIEALSVHPTGPLWGQGTLGTTGGAKRVEEEALADFIAWKQGLENAGIKQARRPLRIAVRDLTWSRPASDQLELNFWLPAGSYATVVLREIICAKSGAQLDESTFKM